MVNAPSPADRAARRRGIAVELGAWVVTVSIYLAIGTAIYLARQAL